MPITINSNIASLNAQRQLQESTSALSQSFERLSSGLRINRASDDAAGLAISSGLQTDSRIASQAIRNANDGISALSIAEGALQQLSTIGVRMEELSEQASNGIYTLKQRTALDQEAQALSAEFSRILGTTSFNGMSLLGSSATTISLQVGYDKSAASQINVTINAPSSKVTGDGNFTALSPIIPGAGTSNLMSGDFNKDGKLDLIYFNSSGDNSILLGNGDGTFKAESLGALAIDGEGNRRGEVIDINGDGNLDVLAVSRTDDAYASITFGNGDGTFKAGVTIQVDPTGGDGGQAAAYDLNGDGKLDLIMDDGNSDSLNIALGNGNGTFKAHVSYTDGSAFVSQATFGDVNGDGKVDIVSGGGRVFLGNGNGTFKLGQQLNTDVRSPALLDVNHDGILDFVDAIGASNGIEVSLGVGDGTFQSQVSYGVGNMTFDGLDLTTADVNGDGSIDILVANTGDNTVSVLLNNGNGTFKAQTSVAVPAGTFSISTGDFNGDGAADILTSDYNAGGITVLLGDTQVQGGLPPVSLLTQQGALSALDALRSTIASISAAAGSIGAGQSRLNIAISNLQVSRENFSSAASQITDVDVASESADLARNQILQQAGAAVLAQANQQPSLALQLLRNL